jgi:hypothetical protein
MLHHCATIDLLDAFLNSCVSFCGGGYVANGEVGEGNLESDRARGIATSLVIDHSILTKSRSRTSYSGKEPYCFSYDKGHVSDSELVFAHVPSKLQEEQSDDSTSAGATSDSDDEISDDDYPQYKCEAKYSRGLSEPMHANTHMRIEHRAEGFVVTQWVDNSFISVCVSVAQAVDITAETCEMIFKLIHEARELLLDPDRRRYAVNSALVVSGVGCLAFSSGALVLTVGGMAALGASLRGIVSFYQDSGRSYGQELCIGAVQGATGALIGAGVGAGVDLIDVASVPVLIGIKACSGAVTGICMQTVEDGISLTCGSRSCEEIFKSDKVMGQVVICSAINATAGGISALI